MRTLARHTQVTLALVLLLAARLKAHQLLFNPTPSAPGILHNKKILAAIIESEMLLAIWLLVGGVPRIRFFCAAACFTVFAIVACYEALHAIPCCGCFGNVKVPPAITAGFDICAVAALWFTRPALSRARRELAESVEGPTEIPPSRRRIAIGTSIALLASAALWTAYFLRHPSIGNGQGSIATGHPRPHRLAPQTLPPFRRHR